MSQLKAWVSKKKRIWMQIKKWKYEVKEEIKIYWRKAENVWPQTLVWNYFQLLEHFALFVFYFSMKSFASVWAPFSLNRVYLCFKVILKWSIFSYNLLQGSFFEVKQISLLLFWNSFWDSRKIPDIYLFPAKDKVTEMKRSKWMEE